MSDIAIWCLIVFVIFAAAAIGLLVTAGGRNDE